MLKAILAKTIAAVRKIARFVAKAPLRVLRGIQPATTPVKARAAMRIGLGTLAYAAATFAWAIAWHIGFFRPMYEAWGYIDANPNFVLGPLSMLIQGAVLSWLYPRVRFSGGAAARGLKFGFSAGAFYWTCHVMAFAAKEDAANTPMFFLLETIYLSVQFGVFGLIIGKIYNLGENPADKNIF